MCAASCARGTTRAKEGAVGVRAGGKAAVDEKGKGFTKTIPKVENLKTSELDAQGSVFDDTGAVEMLSTRYIL